MRSARTGATSDRIKEDEKANFRRISSSRKRRDTSNSRLALCTADSLLGGSECLVYHTLLPVELINVIEAT